MVGGECWKSIWTKHHILTNRQRFPTFNYTRQRFELGRLQFSDQQLNKHQKVHLSLIKITNNKPQPSKTRQQTTNFPPLSTKKTRKPPTPQPDKHTHTHIKAGVHRYTIERERWPPSWPSRAAKRQRRRSFAPRSRHGAAASARARAQPDIT